jgi:ribosomal-protein-alanine N-acetyltransferase
MVSADLPEVMRIERAAFRYPWSELMLRSEMAHEWAHLRIAEKGEEKAPVMLGFIVFWIVCGELHVLNVAVDPDAQHRGVGRALMRAAMDQAKGADVTYATLEVRRTNRAAIRLYESFGFKTTAIRPKYYVENDEDALVMGRAM